MKKIITAIISCLILTSCGVGTYSHSSGKQDIAHISFSAPASYPIVVNIDGQQYNMNTVKNTAYKSGRDIKKTTQNMISVTPGKHSVSVSVKGKEVFSKQVFLSTDETKIIEL